MVFSFFDAEGLYLPALPRDWCQIERGVLDRRPGQLPENFQAQTRPEKSQRMDPPLGQLPSSLGQGHPGLPARQRHQDLGVHDLFSVLGTSGLLSVHNLKIRAVRRHSERQDDPRHLGTCFQDLRRAEVRHGVQEVAGAP